VSLKGFLKKYLIDSMVYDKKAGTKVLSLAVPEMSLVRGTPVSHCSP